MQDTNQRSGSQERAPSNQNRRQGGVRRGAPNRFATQRAARRSFDDASKALGDNLAVVPQRGIRVDPAGKLKVTILGGHDQVGEKNMAILEYGEDAIVVDCGNSLGLDLPGINYSINDTTYLESIRHKLRAYLITHGHLDHMAGLRHIAPRCPAPIFGARYTIGVIEKSFADDETGMRFQPQLVTVDIDDHRKHQVGCFGFEFIRVTHSVPDPAAIAIDTPVGRVVFTGDFRIDPEPLDRKHCDTARLTQIGDEGVLALFSDSSYADAPGRVPTEQTLQQSFHDIIGNAPGRIFVAIFSSNMNRAQMIINAAIAAGRKIVLDGRGMLAYSEIAVKQGILKVPRDLIVPMQQVQSVPEKQLLVMCTGSQGEPNAALNRMSLGEHRFVNLKAGDTVVISSSPIPGNEVRYEENSDRLVKRGVRLFRHPTHEIDGCGPLHVSGHARREELREMITMIRPRFFVPSYAGALKRRYHGGVALEEGMRPSDVLQLGNGDTAYFSATSAELGEQVAHGGVLVDQNGAVVSGFVVRDRLMLSEQGIVAIVVDADAGSGALLAPPDIVTSGFVDHRDASALASLVREAIERKLRSGTDLDADRIRQQLRDVAEQAIFARTRRMPVVILTLNLIPGTRKSSR